MKTNIVLKFVIPEQQVKSIYLQSRIYYLFIKCSLKTRDYINLGYGNVFITFPKAIDFSLTPYHLLLIPDKCPAFTNSALGRKMALLVISILGDENLQNRKI